MQFCFFQSTFKLQYNEVASIYLSFHVHSATTADTVARGGANASSASRFNVFLKCEITWPPALNVQKYSAHKAMAISAHLNLAPAADYCQDRVRGPRMHSLVLRLMRSRGRAIRGNARVLICPPVPPPPSACFIRWPCARLLSRLLLTRKDNAFQANIPLTSPSHASPPLYLPHMTRGARWDVIALQTKYESERVLLLCYLASAAALICVVHNLRGGFASSCM